jgi:TnpA family transposase
MVKYATVLRLGTAQTKDILRRFKRSNAQHPVYRALVELGRAIKTIFLSRYLHSMELRQEINEGLNVIENWSGANDFIYFGKGGEMASKPSGRPRDQYCSRSTRSNSHSSTSTLS